MSSLQYTERNLLEKILGMKTGCVSDFSDRTLQEFVLEKTGIDVFTEAYEGTGTSKANRIRSFWKKESNEITATLIEALLRYANNEKTDYDRELSARDESLFIEAKKIVQRLRDEAGDVSKDTLLFSLGFASQVNSSSKTNMVSKDANNNESVGNLSDEKLLAIIRRAENTNVPGSLYQRANTEWQIRHQQKIIEATKSGHGGISFEVGGDMVNDGVIHTGSGARVDIAVAGNYASKKGKIIQGKVDSKKKIPWYLNEWMKYLVYPFCVGVIVIIVGFMITEAKIPQIFNGNNWFGFKAQSVQNLSEQIISSKDNLRPLEPLETGKTKSELPNGTYFYAISVAIVYEIENPEKDTFAATNEYSKNFSFEIQKIADRYYVVGFISDEAYSRIGSVNTQNSLYTMLFPSSWGGATNPVAIPFDKIYTIKDRVIDLDPSKKAYILDIGFKEVKDRPDVHVR